MRTLISIDWDYFFPLPGSGPHCGLYDWGMCESSFFIGCPVWYTRAAAFLTAGLELPQTTGDELGFMEEYFGQVTIDRRVPLLVSESHLDAFQFALQLKVKHVINFDAHHDLGYRYKSIKRRRPQPIYEEIDCSNWREMARQWCKLGEVLKQEQVS